VAQDVLAERINSVFDREIRRLVAEIAWVDDRLASLGDSEEDEIERTLLRALRRHLMSELRELSGFAGDPFVLMEAEDQVETYTSEETLATT